MKNEIDITIIKNQYQTVIICFKDEPNIDAHAGLIGKELVYKGISIGYRFKKYNKLAKYKLAAEKYFNLNKKLILTVIKSKDNFILVENNKNQISINFLSL